MSTEEAQKKYIYSSSVIHERTHTKKCPTLIRCQQKKRRKNAYVHQALRTRKKKLTALAPEFLENGQRDPYKNSGADRGPPVGHFASRMILIRIRSWELFAINGRKCPASSESKNIDGPACDGAHNNSCAPQKQLLYVLRSTYTVC